MDTHTDAVGESFYRPTPFEISASWVHGLTASSSLPRVAATPREALDAAMLGALLAPPCYVAFSGGRDSSAILASATRLARREGLPDPIPVTELYPDVPESDESSWQQMVIDHLSLADWIRLEFHEENDLLGEVAQAGLSARGLIWPPALQVKSNTLKHLRGGSMLTGEGGDEVFGIRRITGWRALARQRYRPRVPTVKAAAAALAPASLRRRHFVSQMSKRNMQPWLHHDTARRHLMMLAADQASEPFFWDRSVWWVRRRRVAVLASHNYGLLAATNGVRLVEPFLSEGFVAALARSGGRFGYISRSEIMARLFGDVLPAELIQRRDKAVFNRAYIGDSTRSFAQSWSGEGVDRNLVDIDRLRAEWLSEAPSAISSVLLQSAWLGTNPNCAST